MLRLPEGLRDRIKSDADANGRSMNTEIVERLVERINFDLEREIAAVKIEALTTQVALMRHLLAVTLENGGRIPASDRAIVEILALKWEKPTDGSVSAVQALLKQAADTLGKVETLEGDMIPRGE